MINKDSQYPYIIKMTVNKKLSRYEAIMQALHATSFLVKHDGKSSLFVSYHAAACHLSAIHEQLKEVTYIKRNSRILLSVGYSIIGMFDGKEQCDDMGYYDSIEVRSIHSDNVAIKYEIAIAPPQKKSLNK